MKLPLLLAFAVLTGMGSGQSAPPAPERAEKKAGPAESEKRPAPVDLGGLLRFHYENRVRAFRGAAELHRPGGNRSPPHLMSVFAHQEAPITSV